MGGTMNRSKIVLELRDVYSNFIRDRVVIEIRNRVLATEKMRVELKVRGQAVEIDGVAAFPQGLAELTVKPERYRMTSVFVNVPAGSPLTVPLSLFIDPAKAKPHFPSITKLPADLNGLLKRSGFDSKDWNQMDPLKKAGLMNICAKARTIAVEGGRTVADTFQKLIRQQQDRIFPTVDSDLHPKVAALPGIFRPESGALHEFFDGWTRLPAAESFKTRDEAGVLQLTFARDSAGEGLWMVDADLDDHSGIEHAFDVFRHRLTQTDTHPYDIHQILLAFQGLDPGYRLL
jgi:hypothetical protein